MAITGASLQPIYDRLHAVQGYHPMSADTFADWTVEAGDMVTMSRDGEEIVAPIHNAKIVWRGSPQITLNSTGNEERESIAKVSRRKYGRGGGMNNDQRLYFDMWSEDGHLHSELEITESVLRTEYSAADSRLQSEFELTASHLRTEFTDADNALRGEIEVTASHLRTEYTDADNALRGEIEVTASHLRADYTAADGRLEGELEMTASHLRTEFTDSDERLKSEFEITASHLQTEFQDADARLASEMEITASHMRTEYTDGINSVHSEVVQTASTWNAKISGVVDSEGNVTAASIAIAINASTGESEAIIDAQKVYIGNQKSTTVINGKCSLSDVSADYIKGQIATLGRLFCSEMEGNMYGHNLLFASGLTPYGTTVYTNVKSLIKAVQIAGPTSNTYKLQYQTYNDDSETWHDAGSFSRATSLSGAWSGGHLEVTASPQNEKFHQYLEDSHVKQNYDGTEYTSGPIWYVPIYWKYDPNEQTSHETGYRITVNTTNMLQSKTVTSNGVVYPDSGYLGLESVDVQVPAPSVTPVISYAWSSTGQLTVSTTPAAQADLVRRLGQDTSSISWNGNTATIPIVARFTVDSQERSEATNFSATVDATSRYRAGSLNVNLADPTWSTPAGTNITVSENTATVSTTGRVNSSGADANVSKTVPIKTSQGDWNTSTNKKYVYVHYSSTANTNRIARVEVDAGAIYSNGVTAGKNAVSINKGSWSNGQVQFTKSEGTASTKGVKVGLSGSWSGNSYNYTINDYYDNSQGVSTGYTGSIDASSIRTAGKNDVTLNNPSWNNGSPYTSGATNTVTVSTSGRPTQLSKTVPVTLVQNAWSGNSKTVDIQTTNGAVVARITVDASTIYNAGKTYAFGAVTVVYDANRRCVPVNDVGEWTGNYGVDVGAMLDDIRFSVSALGSSSVSTSPSISAKAHSTGNNVAQTLALEKSSYNPTSGVTDRCVNLKMGSTIFGRIDTQDVYGDGYSAGKTYAFGAVRVVYDSNRRCVPVDDVGGWTGNLGVDVGAMLDDIRFSVTAGDIANANRIGTVNAKASSDGTVKSTTLTLERGSYPRPGDPGSMNLCVNLKSGSTIFGRIDIESVWAEGYNGYYYSENWSIVDNRYVYRPKKYEDGYGSELWFDMRDYFASNSMYLTRQYTYTDSTPTTRYYGILYWKNSGGGYTACTDSSCYWYRSSTNISSRTVYY